MSYYSHGSHICLHKGELNGNLVAVHTDGWIDYYGDDNRVYKSENVGYEITPLMVEKWFNIKFSE